MKKKTYKRLIRRINNETAKRMYVFNAMTVAKRWAAEAEAAHARILKRFRDFEQNVKTVDPGSGKNLVMVKWEMTPEQFGAYSHFVREWTYMSAEEQREYVTHRLAEQLAAALMKEDIAQMFCTDTDFRGGPLGSYGTVGVKLYVVPFEQVPHRRTVEIQQMVENALAVESKYGEEMSE